MTNPGKLVLAVIDGVKPTALDRAVATGRAPAMKHLIEHGHYADDCVSVFPSVTPVCAASITTGVGPDEHHIPSMNWFSRDEDRYVEYGSSIQASRAHGIGRSLNDTVYNMNLEHLSKETPTVFESLDDVDVRTAGTTYLIYRGRHEHEAMGDTALARLVTSTLFRKPVLGPRELFYADLFASRRTGCRGALGNPGQRDQHTGCVGAYMVEHDLFDFMLFSLPDNDSSSHKTGPHAQVATLAHADRQIERIMHAGGGPERFLEEHAVIVIADHSHSLVEKEASLQGAFDAWTVRRPNDAPTVDAELAVCPSWRFGMVYSLDASRTAELAPQIGEAALAAEGVDLAMWLEGDEAVVAGGDSELRFAPGGDVRDLREQGWALSGDESVLALERSGDTVTSDAYPDAFTRVWSALQCRTMGDVLISAAPGYEFMDWGGKAHVGGGSHGSLHHSDSNSILITAGIGAAAGDERAQWSLRDVAPMVRKHFGV